MTKRCTPSLLRVKRASTRAMSRWRKDIVTFNEEADEDILEDERHCCFQAWGRQRVQQIQTEKWFFKSFMTARPRTRLHDRLLTFRRRWQKSADDAEKGPTQWSPAVSASTKGKLTSQHVPNFMTSDSVDAKRKPPPLPILCSSLLFCHLCVLMFPSDLPLPRSSAPSLPRSSPLSVSQVAPVLPQLCPVSFSSAPPRRHSVLLTPLLLLLLVLLLIFLTLFALAAPRPPSSCPSHFSLSSQFTAHLVAIIPLWDNTRLAAAVSRDITSTRNLIMSAPQCPWVARSHSSSQTSRPPMLLSRQPDLHRHCVSATCRSSPWSSFLFRLNLSQGTHSQKPWCAGEELCTFLKKKKNKGCEGSTSED